MAAAAELRKQGFSAPVCVVVHPIFGGDAFAKTSEAFPRIVSTDTLPHSSNAITVTSLIASALKGDSRD